ncbi:GtrA family protein [Luteipulveratus sp. YIM 133132]|uniref:GtrA family protein n=1 Tax=Luteipulveratus flavus TaxID=3031728 RepID=A0ABT6C6B9_9MICO|nr:MULTISPECIES: GtrA family protein [unclassified Luteipulveratus]MDE9365214.1 GtrA family protein [Luteipulveratus sp. YIM 133132]MDF8264449.1 GtrA family protein [Luteipulveratus sp. YIM 133296]
MNAAVETTPQSTSTSRQLVGFAVVGVLGFATDVGGFNLLRFAGGEGPLHDYPLTAKIVSGVAATVVAWLGNRYWTFRHSRRAAKHREFLLFAAVAVMGTLIALGCLWISHYLLDLRSPLADNISANGIGLVLATVFRFWAYRAHVFSEHGDHSSLSELAEHGHHHADSEETTKPADADG